MDNFSYPFEQANDWNKLNENFHFSLFYPVIQSEEIYEIIFFCLEEPENMVCFR